MTDEPTKTVDVYITKFSLKSGMIFHAKAEELGTTGRIRIVEGDMRNLEFQPSDFETLEFLAYEKMREKLKREIVRVEADLERLKKLDFSGPTQTEEPTE